MEKKNLTVLNEKKKQPNPNPWNKIPDSFFSSWNPNLPWYIWATRNHWNYCLRCAAASELQRSVQTEAQHLRFELKHQKAPFGEASLPKFRLKRALEFQAPRYTFSFKTCVWTIHSFPGKRNLWEEDKHTVAHLAQKEAGQVYNTADPLSIHFTVWSATDLDGCDQLQGLDGQGKSTILYIKSHAWE